MSDFPSNKAAIVGVGESEYSNNSGRSVLSLAVEACRNAIEDAGLTLNDVDGVLTFNVGDSVSPDWVAASLGLPKLNYSLEMFAGGFAPAPLVQMATLLITSGTCKSVLIYRAMNGRSGFRLGGSEQAFEAKGMWQYRMPYGYLTYAQTMAMWCRRHMLEYGTSSDHLAAIVINQRHNAIHNERAVKRSPITLEDYYNSKMITDPFRLFDICLETDGACAVLITSAEQSRDCKKQPVYIKAAANVSGPGIAADWADFFLRSDMTENFTATIAPVLYRQAGITVKDIDVAEIYDCFSHTVLLGLEGLGFCEKGEGGPFAASGAIARDGTIPVNTGGGMLSEAYIHGVNVLAEAVRQLREECGVLQVPDAIHAVVTSGAWQNGGGLILTNDEGR
jgi:acetyl-CoA acetyltransferase